MSEGNQVKSRTTTSYIPLYGGILGLVLCILISSVCVLGYLFVSSNLRHELLDLDTRINWLVISGIFAGPLGAVFGAFVAAELFLPEEESKKVTHSLLPVLGGMVGLLLGFWIPAITIFRMMTRETLEMMVPGGFYGVCAGLVMAPLSAAGGVYLAKQLLKASSKEGGSS